MGFTLCYWSFIIDSSTTDFKICHSIWFTLPSVSNCKTSSTCSLALFLIRCSLMSTSWMQWTVSLSYGMLSSIIQTEHWQLLFRSKFVVQWDFMLPHNIHLRFHFSKLPSAIQMFRLIALSPSNARSSCLLDSWAEDHPSPKTKSD